MLPWRGVFALVVLAGMLALTPLAQASPIDPNFGGLYDNGDFDDVIVLIISTGGIVDTEPLVDASPFRLVVGFVLPVNEVPALPPRPSADPTRTPPLS